MNNSDKIIRIVFEQGQVQKRAEVLTEWDYGQVLEVHGLDIPNGVIEVDFSLSENEGAASTFLGTVENNVITVDIPDFMFQNENTYDLPQYEAYAFIYQSDGVSGKTIRKIIFPIQSRPSRTTDVPKDKKDQFLQEVRSIMNATKEIAQSVRTDADNGVFSGIPGKKGADGKSAYEFAQEGGFKGTEEEFTELIAQAGQVDLSGYVTKEKHEEEISKLAIKTTTSPSPFHHITDSANMKVVDFGMEGKTEQETVPGNQLFDKDSVSIKRGLLQSNGTAVTNTNYCYTDYIAILPNTTYAAKVFSTGINVTGMWFYDENKTFISKSEATSYVTSPETCVYIVYGFAKSVIAEITDDDLQTLSDSFMLVQGSSAPTTYEPFTNGPSPNPDFKQEIVNAGVYNEETGRYEIGCSVGNKNLIVNEATNKNIFGVDFTVNDDGSIAIKGTNIHAAVAADFVLNEKMLLKAGKYTLNDGGVCLTNNKVFLALNILGTSSYIYTNNVGDGTKVFELTKDSYVKIYVRVSGGATVDVVMYPMLNVYGDGLAFAPLVAKKLTLTSPVPLTKWDKLVKRDGVWGWSIWSALYEFTADTLRITGNNADETKVRMYISGAEGISNSEVFCNMIRYGGRYATNGTCAYWYGTSFCMYPFNSWLEPYGYIYDSTLSNTTNVNNAITAFKAMVADKGAIQILSQRSTEQSFHPLPDEEQTLLNNLETYYGVTNLYNDQGCPMWLEYVNDTKLYTDQQIAKQIATTQALILEN